MAVNNKQKIAVLAGGIGEERDISIQSGHYVTEALTKVGFNVTKAEITPDNRKILENKDIDIFFIALHGEFGEDGQLQQILEDKSLIYTGSGPAASRLAFDKKASKDRFVKAGINTPRTIEFDPHIGAAELEKKLEGFSDKYVIKPRKQGSSVGVSIVFEKNRAALAAHKTYRRFGDCLIEEFIPGKELTVGIVCDEPLPIIEIRSRAYFYDYQSKYIDEKTEFLFDTIKDHLLSEKIKSTALNCFKVLGCRDFARVDFILGNDGKVYALEVNSIPGLTSHSLVPKAAAKAGMTMDDLCIRIIEAAAARRAAEAIRGYGNQGTGDQDIR
jgi:D-alanine-D-alanine ligase